MAEVDAPEVVSPLRIPEFRRLLAIAVTVAIGFGILIPVLPLFAQSFGVGLAAVGLVQLVFGLTRFSFNVAGGLAVDRFGERATTITGILIVALSSYAAGFSQTFAQLVLARGFGGAGSALFIAGLMNRILRLVDPRAMGRATGAFRSSFLVGTAIGPLIGGVVARHLGLAAPFHIYATALLIAAAVAWFAMAGGDGARRVEQLSPLESLRAARPVFKDARYGVALAATFVGWWTLSGPGQVVTAVYAKDALGYSEDLIGLALSLLALGELATLTFSGRAADRYGRRAVLLPAMVLTALATAALGRIESTPWAFFMLMPLIGSGVAAGSTAAGGLLADAIGRGGSGAAVGVNQMAGDFGYLIAPTLIGWIAEPDHGGFPLGYTVAAVPAVLVFLFALRLPHKLGRPAEPVHPAQPVG